MSTTIGSRPNEHPIKSVGEQVSASHDRSLHLAMTEHFDPDYVEELKLLGARIKEARTQRGLTVRDMVIQHDYHDAQWRRFEKGASLTVPSLIRIAKALGMSLSVLLDGIGEFSVPRVDDLRGRPSQPKRASTEKADRSSR